MNSNHLVKLAVVSALVAVVAVIVLKLLGQSNPTVIAGGVAGGVAGALSSALFRKKESGPMDPSS